MAILGSLSLAILLIQLLEAKVSFIKDQGMDAVFPGPVYSQAPSLPAGHMRPLGWQRKTDGPVKEMDSMPATQDFSTHHVSRGEPGVFRNAIVEAPALDTWADDDHLLDKYGQLNISVMVRGAKKKDDVVMSADGMKFKRFLKEYMYEAWYVHSLVPLEMMDELPLPKCIRCGTLREHLVSAKLWMSSGGTSGAVHSHDNHLLHCVVFGRRDFILVEGRYKKAFNLVQDFPGSLGGHSTLNTEMINTFKFKDILRTPWTWATLYSKDCIFVPAGYVHQVRSYGRTISTTIEFSPFPRFDNSGCTLTEADFVPLSDVKFLLTFQNGRPRLTESELLPPHIRVMLEVLMGNSDVLSESKFSNFYNQLVHQRQNFPKGRKVFSILTGDDDGNHVTRGDLLKLPNNKLEVLAEVLNSVTAATMHEREGEEWHGYKHEEL